MQATIPYTPDIVFSFPFRYTILFLRRYLQLSGSEPDALDALMLSDVSPHSLSYALPISGTALPVEPVIATVSLLRVRITAVPFPVHIPNP